MAKTQTPIGFGTIEWVGKNFTEEKFSIEANSIMLARDGIIGDKYRQMFRMVSSHDVDYVAIDGIQQGSEVLNHRQITIVDIEEIRVANILLETVIQPGWLRENIGIKYQPREYGPLFSKLPPSCRMVIGENNPHVLLLTEENGPCNTIARPIAAELGTRTTEYAEQIKNALAGRRGKMAMVRSCGRQKIQVGDMFKIFPPML